MLPRTVLAIWIVLLGGCIGSFLNVVVYRLPRGLSLVRPGSFCPHCGHAIRWHHNIPVIGWLIVGGRCHDCGARISCRYPLIEAIVAGMFLAIACRGPLATLPESEALLTDAVGAMPWAAWLVYGYDMTLLCGLLALAMMEVDAAADGQLELPWRWIGGMVLVGLLVPALWEGVGITAAGESRPAGETMSWPAMAGLGHLAGLAAAVLLASVVRMAAAGRSAVAGTDRLATASLLLTGTFLGALAVSGIATATALGCLLVAGLGRFLAVGDHRPSTPLVWALALAAMLLWGQSIHGTPGIEPWRQTLVVLAAGCGSGVLSLLSWTIAR